MNEAPAINAIRDSHITVLDETLLSSADFGYARDFIRKSFLIRAIISLPGDTFRRSGSRVKTSVLVLEKKKSRQDVQPKWFYFFAENIGLDDLNTKASEQDVTDARQQAERKAERIVADFRNFMNGDDTPNILGPERIMDRLDLRNCVPMFGRMADSWKANGVSVNRLDDVVGVVEKQVRPSDHPDDVFNLVKVSYGGKCEVDESETRPKDSCCNYAASGNWANCILHDPRNRWSYRHRPTRVGWGAGLRQLHCIKMRCAA